MYTEYYSLFLPPSCLQTYRAYQKHTVHIPLTCTDNISNKFVRYLCSSLSFMKVLHKNIDYMQYQVLHTALSAVFSAELWEMSPCKYIYNSTLSSFHVWDVLIHITPKFLQQSNRAITRYHLYMLCIPTCSWHDTLILTHSETYQNGWFNP